MRLTIYGLVLSSPIADFLKKPAPGSMLGLEKKDFLIRLPPTETQSANLGVMKAARSSRSNEVLATSGTFAKIKSNSRLWLKHPVPGIQPANLCCYGSRSPIQIQLMEYSS